MQSSGHPGRQMTTWDGPPDNGHTCRWDPANDSFARASAD